MSSCCKKIEESCRIHGVKFTPHRMLIAKVICESDDHPDAEEIYERASKKDSKISLATIYRSLFLFEKQGSIRKLEWGDGKARYEITDHIHHHLIDIKNGKILEFNNKDLNEVLNEIAIKLGYRIINCRIELRAIPISHENDDKDSGATKEGLIVPELSTKFR